MKFRHLIPLFFSLLLVTAGFVASVAEGQQEFNLFGPIIDKEEYRMIISYDTRILAFEAGDVDIVGVLPKDLERIRNSKPVREGGEVVRTVSFNTLNALQFNIRDRIGPVGAPENPDTTLPFNAVSIPAVRKAFADLIDRDKIVFGPLLQGNAIKATTLVPPPHGDWINPDKSRVDYEVRYPFNIERANALLDQAGLVRPAGQKFRVYTAPRTDPAGRPYADAGQTKTLEVEILVLPEATNPVGFQVAQQYVENGEKAGILVKARAVSFATLDALVDGTRTYQAYILGWSFGIFPTFVRTFFHSDEDRWTPDRRPGGFNEGGVRNSEVDKALDEFRFTTDVEKAKRALWRAQEILTDIVPWVPTYTGVGFTAISAKWRGKVLNFAPPSPDPVGFSWLTDLNLLSLSPETKQPVFGGRFVLPSDIIIGTLNPMTFLWAAENAIISTIYDFSTVLNPVDVYRQPRIRTLLDSWSSEEIVLDGRNATMITLKLQDGLKWHDGTPLTAFDYEWTLQNPGVKWRALRYFVLDSVKNLVRTEVVDPLTIKIFIKARSWLFLAEQLGFRPLPRHLLSKVTDPFGDLSRLPHPERADLTLMVGTGPFILTRHEGGRVVQTVWNPEYHLRHPQKGLKLEATLAGSVEEGTTATLQVKVHDFLDRVVTDAEVDVAVTGPVSSRLAAAHTSGGVYTLPLTGAIPGAYSVEIAAKKAIPYGFLRGKTTVSVNVFPKGLPPPPVAPKVEERVPTPIALPSVPSLPAAPTLPQATVALEIIAQQALQLVALAIVLILGILVARKRT